MFMDISSELIHSLLPVFMVSTLGASALAVGLVEGIAEATALIAKVFSGTLSDYLGKRKGLAVFGYGLGAISKPFFATATGVPSVLAARFMDRIGKGMRGAPRDALVADLTPESIRCAAYGLRQSLDTIGAFLGPLFAMALMVVYYEKSDRIWLRRWAAIVLGEGKDSKSLTPPEEENLLRFARDLHLQYHRGYITPEQLRELAAMGHTASEKSLSSRLLRKWVDDGEVLRVRKGIYQFVAKEVPKVDLAEILRRRLAKTSDSQAH